MVLERLVYLHRHANVFRHALFHATAAHYLCSGVRTDARPTRLNLCYREFSKIVRGLLALEVAEMLVLAILLGK